TLEIARAVPGDAVAEREVLRARRRANRIGLDETEPVERALQRGGYEQGACDSGTAKVSERHRVPRHMIDRGGSSMRVLSMLALSSVFALPQGAAVPRAAGCDPAGNVRFVCGLVGPEDLVIVPGSNWVIASGMAAPGAMTLVDIHTKTTTALYPSANLKQRL